MGHWFQSPPALGRGNFRAANDELLPLFGDPGTRTPRRWRQSFGYDRASSLATVGEGERAPRRAEMVV